MKKIILGMAMMMAGVAFGNAQNQNTTCPQQACPEQACPQQAVCTQQPAGCGLNDRCGGNCPFEGLNLSGEQQEKIKDLNNAMQVSKKELRQEAKTEKRDITAKRKELRQKYVDDLEKILSHEQFMSYLKNYYVNNSDNGPRIQRAERGRFGKAGHPTKAAIRSERISVDKK